MRLAVLDLVLQATAAAMRPPLGGGMRRFRGETRRYFGRKICAIYSGLARRIVIGRCHFLSVVNICYRVLSWAQKRYDNK